MAWEVGQKAVIDRRLIVTIEKVSATGRATANGMVFDIDGFRRGDRSRFSIAKLEALTPEIQAEMDLVARGIKVDNETASAIRAADNWLRQSFGGMGRRIPEIADVERAERLIAAIRSELP